MRFLKILLVLFLLTKTQLFSQQLPSLPEGWERITSVEGITEYRLKNGLRVLLFPDPTKQTITVNITYLVGSVHENYGETGMAHFLEHMLFRGTPTRPGIRDEMTQHGARYNGTTWLDRTNYFETFAATEENLEWALAMEADRMVNAAISEKDLAQEMTVVRNEFEAGENQPFSVLLQRVLSTAFLWHNYGNTTIGARSDIENVPVERLRTFYKKYYQPDNAVLLLAGNFDEAKVVRLIHRYFSPIPKPERILPRFYTEEPTQDGERSVTLRRVGDIQLVEAGYHVPAGSHPDSASIDILTFILADTPAGRLHKALVETKKATSVWGFHFQLRQPGIVLYGAEVRKEGPLEEVKDELLKIVEGVPQNPVTREEVERARTALLKEIELSVNSADRVGLELSEWIAMGDWRLFFLHRDRLRKVTPEDVQRVAAYLKPSNRTLGLFIPTAKPDRTEIPKTPPIAEMLKDYKGDAAVQAGEAFDPSPANIHNRLIQTTAGEHLKIALLPKKTRGNSVVARMTFRFGNLEALKNRTTAAALTGGMLMRGTVKHTRQQIQDELDRLKARVYVSGSTDRATVSLETIGSNLPDVLRLVEEILKEPSFPENELEILKQEQLASLEDQQSDPQALASLRYERHLNPYPKDDPRYVPTLEEEIENIKAAKLEDIRSFYKDFYGASVGEIVVIGDFDEKTIAELLRNQYGKWKSPLSYRRMENIYYNVPPIHENISTPDKPNAFFLAGHNIPMRDDDPDYPALLFANYLFGSAPNSRLKIRIRDREGLSYGVGSALSASPLDESGRLTVYAIYAPQNADRLEAVFQEELEKVLKEGFKEEEVKAARLGFRQSRQVSRAQDRELADRLLTYLFIDRSILWEEELEKKIDTLTPQQIQEAMRKHIDPQKLSIVKAGDFEKATPEK